MSKPSALGRGLGSLIPQTTPVKTLTEEIIPSAKQEFLDIPVLDVRQNPRQPRKYFEPEALEELKKSITQHGLMQPIVVTRKGHGFELIAGERRLRAHKELELEVIPAIVREASEQEKLELALIENVQRQQLNAVEEAMAYKALIEEFGLSQTEVAERVGKNSATISNDVRLLDLDPDMLDALRRKEITKGHARMLLAEHNQTKRQVLFEEMLLGKMSVREAEARVLGVGKRKSVKDPNLAALERKMREVFGTKVVISERGGKGMVKISFYSKEELLELLDRLNEIGT